MQALVRPATLLFALAVLAAAAPPVGSAEAVPAPPWGPTQAVPDTGRIASLPLVEVPARQGGGHVLALLISGDGDWAAFARGTAQALAAEGIPVVGLRARAYMGSPRTPESTARDMERVLRTYLARWDRDEIVLVGYSRGADWMLFVANRLPPDLRQRVRLVALRGPERMASFEFQLTDLVRSNRRPTDIPTLPELERMRGLRILCVYGRGERESLCPDAPAGMLRSVELDGGHRANDPGGFAALILEELRGTR